MIILDTYYWLNPISTIYSYLIGEFYDLHTIYCEFESLAQMNTGTLFFDIKF